MPTGICHRTQARITATVAVHNIIPGKWHELQWCCEKTMIHSCGWVQGCKGTAAHPWDPSWTMTCCMQLTLFFTPWSAPFERSNSTTFMCWWNAAKWRGVSPPYTKWWNAQCLSCSFAPHHAQTILICNVQQQIPRGSDYSTMQQIPCDEHVSSIQIPHHPTMNLKYDKEQHQQGTGETLLVIIKMELQWHTTWRRFCTIELFYFTTSKRTIAVHDSRAGNRLALFLLSIPW